MRWLGLLVASVSLTSACKSRTPEIGRDLPSNFREGSKVFSARVQATYPKGTSEERLVDDLRKQGFVLLPKHEDWKCAVFTRKSMVLHIKWSVCWRAEGSKVVSIGGTYSGVGP
jgi:hypothetical protein